MAPDRRRQRLYGVISRATIVILFINLAVIILASGHRGAWILIGIVAAFSTICITVLALVARRPR